MNEEESIERLLSSNRRRVKVQIDRLTALLHSIKPRPGNFLFTDLIGRLVWNSAAIANSIDQLADQMNDYGIASMLRKSFECKVLLTYMFSAEKRSVVIARIMAYEFFNISQVRIAAPAERLPREKAIEDARKIVAGFNEDPGIIDLFASMIGDKRAHWHWIGESFERAIAKLNASDVDSFKRYSEYAHVNISEDHLLPIEAIEYESPLSSSRTRVAGLLGLVFIINLDIINIVQDNRELIGFDGPEV